VNDAEPRELAESGLEERLLDYDAALAAGNPPARMLSDDVPEDIREGFSCLDMLDRLRLCDRIAEVLAPLHADDSCDPSASTETTTRFGLRTNEEAKVPAQLGRFQIVKVIGQGGCGVVFLAQDPALHRQVAVKVPRPEALITPELRQRFLREGRAAACLDHPNIVAVYEAGEIGAICYLASAYCAGITLREWLHEYGGPVAPRAAANLIATLADAMRYAHEIGVCHRDLKPSNILLQSGATEPREPTRGMDCRLSVRERASFRGAKGDSVEPAPLSPRDLQLAIPKIIDFGLAKVLGGDPGEAGTRSGAVFGTPHYMAPEQAQGRTRLIGPATDIHALGVILYELLTGHVPFQGDTDLEILGQVAAVEPVCPRRVRRQVPRELETICLKCLEKQPEKRYGSMQDLAEDLHRFLDGRPIQARRIGWAGRVAKLARRRPRATAAGALTGVLLCSLIAVLIWISRRESIHRDDLIKARQEIGSQKARADDQDWMVRNHQYAAHIRSGGVLKNEGRLAPLRDLLLGQIPGHGQKDVRGFEWHYLWRSGEGFMLPENASPVAVLAYSQRGDIYASGSQNGTIDLYERRTGRLLAKLEGHNITNVKTLHFLKNDTELLSTAIDTSPDAAGGSDGFILWSLVGEPRVLRRRSYLHVNHGDVCFALARAARILFILDHPSAAYKFDLRLVSWGDGSGVPTSAMNLVILGVDNSGLLHVRIFDAGGKLITDTDETKLPGIWSTTIANLKRELSSVFPPHVLTGAEKAGVIRKATVIAGQTPSHRIMMLDLETGSEHELMRKDEVFLIAAAPDAGRIAVSHTPTPWIAGISSLDLLETATKQRISTVNLDKYVHVAAFSPDGKALALGEGINHPPYRVEIRDVPSLRLRKSIECSSLPYSLVYDWPGKRLLVTMPEEGAARIFGAQSGMCLGRYDTAGVAALAFSPDGEEIAKSGFDGRVFTGKHVFDRQEYSIPGPPPKSEAWCLAFSPDGSTLAAGYDNAGVPEQQTLRLWDLTTKKSKTLFGHDAIVMALAFSPDGKTLATASYDRTVRLWDMADGKCLRKLTGHTDAVRALALSANGTRVASAGSDLSIRMWNVNDGSSLKSWHGHEDVIRALAFAPNGKLLISAANDRTIKVWDAEEGALVRSIPDESQVQSVACSPDGLLLASGNANNSVELWQLDTGAPWKSLPGHSGRVRSVAFSPDGKTLASGGEDKTVRLWNVASGQELLVLPTEHFVDGLAFDGRSRTLAAALHDGTVKIWSGE
jgi:WD40 repeat protein